MFAPNLGRRRRRLPVGARGQTRRLHAQDKSFWAPVKDKHAIWHRVDRFGVYGKALSLFLRVQSELSRSPFYNLAVSLLFHTDTISNNRSSELRTANKQKPGESMTAAAKTWTTRFAQLFSAIRPRARGKQKEMKGGGYDKAEKEGKWSEGGYRFNNVVGSQPIGSRPTPVGSSKSPSLPDAL